MTCNVAWFKFFARSRCATLALYFALVRNFSNGTVAVFMTDGYGVTTNDKPYYSSVVSVIPLFKC